MIRKWWLLALALSFAIVASSAPAISNNGNTDEAYGYLVPSSSCPQAAYALMTACPTDPPTVIMYVFSTKVDLSVYAYQHVNLRGSIQAGSCGVPLFKAGKVATAPPPPCPAP